ncbi:MAG: circadian clock KaiB family protein [Pirellulaceae bacterium]
MTGLTPRSVRAIGMIRRICDEYLADCHSLEIIDIYQRPIIARSDQIVACPTLVIETDSSVRRIVGDLSCEARVLSSLNIRQKK